MSATLLTVSDEVLSKLNEHDGFTQQFTAERLYVPEFDLRDMATLHVSVVPKDERLEALTRALSMKICDVDVAVQKRVPQQTNEVIDPLVLLVEEIVDLLDGAEIIAQSRCTAIKPEPIYAQDHMKELRQFTSVITLTVKVLP